MCASGAKILHLRCVEYARRYDIPIHVRSSFSTEARVPGSRTRLEDQENTHGASDHLRRRTRPQRGQDHRRRRSRQARRGGADLRGPGRRRDQHRHDRAEHLRRRHRPDRHLVHAAARPTARPRWPRWPGSRTRSATTSCCTTTRSARSRWSAPACAATPASPRSFFAALADAGVNIEMISTSEIRISVVIDEDQSTPPSPPFTPRSTSTATRSRPSSTEGPDDERPREAHPGRRRRDRRRRHGDARASCRTARTSGARSGCSPRPARPARCCRCRGEELVVEALTEDVFDGVDVAMFDVPDEVSAAVGADRGRARRRRGRQLRRVPDGPRRAAGRARGQPGPGPQPARAASSPTPTARR